MKKKTLLRWLERRVDKHIERGRAFARQTEEDLTRLSNSGLIDNLALHLQAKTEIKIACAFELCRRKVKKLECD